MSIEISQNTKNLSAFKIYYAVQERLILTLNQGETGGSYKLSLRARLDPNTASMCDAAGVEANGKVTFHLNTSTQEFKRVCDSVNTADASSNSTLVWLEIYDETASHVLVQGQIQIGCRAATLNGQPSAPVENYIPCPSGGSAGHVLTKTATGTQWAAQTQSDWNQSDDSAVDFIKNKPSIPAANVQPDWEEDNSASMAYIQNKPELSEVAISGDYGDLSNTPTIPTALAELSADATHRTVTDAEKATWSGKTDLTLGEAANTAFPGNRGKAAEDGLAAHIAGVNNPHSVTAAQVGLGNVNNTSDADKPISTAMQSALNAKLTEPAGRTANKVLGTDASNILGWLTMPGFTVGPCTSLGRIIGSGVNTLSWADPDDVILNGAIIAQWVKTILVRKNGSYPVSHTDGTLIASTDRSAGTKNAYRDTGYTDTPPAGETSYYALFSLSSAGVWNALAANWLPSSESYSWYNIRAIVRSGTAATHFPVGTVFEVPHSEYAHTNGTGLLFRVVGHDLMNPADGSLTHSMLLDMVDCMFTSQYDASEYAYALTADTVATTGKVYYTLSGTTYTALTEGTDWNPGDPVPVATWYEKNDTNRAANGNSNPLQSNLMQWLNSDGLVNNWFTPQNIWDTCVRDLAAKNGFCRNIDQDFLSVVATATLKTALYSLDGGGIAIHTAKFFPLCRNQLFNDQSGENVNISYYSSNDLRKKTLFDGTTYTNYWMRTAHLYYSSSVYYVTSSGSSFNERTNITYGVSPACIIA